MKLSLPKALLGAAALCAVATVGTAQIVRLDLRQMVQRTDGAVIGTITNKEVIRRDHPIDGPELYFTFLTIEGETLDTGEAKTVEVVYPGGFIDADHGVFNSEAPTEAETSVGNRVVAFYRWVDDLGGDVAGNALYASHGGLFRTARVANRTIVQGRGEGYAIDTNVERAELGTRVRQLKRQ
jgi:hypothetical protein